MDVLSNLAFQAMTQELARVAAYEATKAAAQEAAKAAAQEAAKAAAQEAAKAAAQEAAKSAVKVASKAIVIEVVKEGSKSVTKASVETAAIAVPFIGLAFGTAFAAWEILRAPTNPKSYAFAVTQLAAGASSLIPGIGTAASISLSAGIAACKIADAVNKASKQELSSSSSTPQKESNTSNTTKSEYKNNKSTSEQDGEDDEKKFWKYLEECKLNVDKSVISALKNKMNKNVKKRLTESKSDRNRIDQKLTNNERKVLNEKIDEMIKKGKSPGGNLNSNFRLDQPSDKGSFEVQRNGVKGKTTVGQTMQETDFQAIINSSTNHAKDIQQKFDILVLEKLKDSINTSTDTLNISVITLNDFLELIINLLKTVKK